MKRFMGMMPSSEIEKEERFKDKDGLSITIQAGKNGWTILYADGSSEYNDKTCSTEENFSTAYNIATDHLGELTSAKDKHPINEYEC